MNAASLPMSAGAPAASSIAAAVAGAPRGVVGGGGFAPVDGQGFVPVAGSGNAPAAPGGAPPTAGTPSAAPPGGAGDGSIPAEQALQALQQELGAEFDAPIIAADGSVYMARKSPSAKDGRIVLTYMLVGKIDKSTRRMKISPVIIEALQKKAAGAAGQAKAEEKLVKVGENQYVWQTLTRGPDGKIVGEERPATEAELAAYEQKMRAQQAQQAAQAQAQDSADWQQKIGKVAQNVGLFGSAGQVVMGLSGGPNPMTGRPGAGWISGWILAQRLNGKAEGKLLPSWLQQGPLATALDWGIQAYGMLDMGNDFKVVGDFLSKAPPPPQINPGAVELLMKQGHHKAVAEAMAGMGAEFRNPAGPTLQVVQGTANAAVLNTKLGAVQLVPKDALHQAIAATDPIQDAGLRIRGQVDSGVVKGLGMLKGLIQPAMIGATALGAISSTMRVKDIIAKQGVGALIDTQGGRGALLGAISSVAFLGLYLAPSFLPQLGLTGAALGAASSAINIASNVVGGVQMLNSYGLFGDEGFLNNDAFRAAFLIPPLTPLGAFAFWMKGRRKKQEEAQLKVQAAQKLAAERLAQQREMVRLQLQATGQVAGTTVGADGTVVVPTNIPNDMAQLVAQLGSPGSAAPPTTGGAPPGAPPGAAAASGQNSALEQRQQQLAMVARPMR